MNDDVPSVEIWLGNFIKHLAGIVEARLERESTGCDELAG
jgi:hypothetical protein